MSWTLATTTSQMYDHVLSGVSFLFKLNNIRLSKRTKILLLAVPKDYRAGKDARARERGKRES